jgi:hypothetical protein
MLYHLSAQSLLQDDGLRLLYNLDTLSARFCILMSLSNMFVLHLMSLDCSPAFFLVYAYL